MKLQDYISKYGNIEVEEKQLNELLNIKESKVWKPNRGDEYYYIYADGDIKKLIYCGAHYDNDCLLLGNVYQTKEEAEFAVEKRKIEIELQRYADEHNDEIDWNNCNQWKFYIFYDCFNKKIYIDCYLTYKSNDVYFTSKEIAEQAIEAIGEERLKKYYFRMED